MIATTTNYGRVLQFSVILRIAAVHVSMQSRQMRKRHFCLFVTVTNVLTERKSVNITVILCQRMDILSSDIYSVARVISISGLGDHIAISGCWSLSESCEGTFFELATVENPRFAV